MNCFLYSFEYFKTLFQSNVNDYPKINNLSMLHKNKPSESEYTEDWEITTV